MGVGVVPVPDEVSRTVTMRATRERDRGPTRRRLLLTRLCDLRHPADVARDVRDGDQQNWRRCVSANPLGATTYAALRSAFVIHSGSTIRGVGTAGSGPLAPTISTS